MEGVLNRKTVKLKNLKKKILVTNLCDKIEDLVFGAVDSPDDIQSIIMEVSREIKKRWET